jgi:Protein of unknown function (DUF1656).
MTLETRCLADQVRKRLYGSLPVLLAMQALAPQVRAAQSPSIDVLGSYFPAWLICIVAGVVLTVVARLLFSAWKIHPHLWAAPLVYVCLATVFALTIWLLVFRN